MAAQRLAKMKELAMKGAADMGEGAQPNLNVPDVIPLVEPNSAPARPGPATPHSGARGGPGAGSSQQAKGKSQIAPDAGKNTDAEKRKKSSHDSGSRRESKKIKHSKEKALPVTAIPLDEQFLKQSYEEWLENPLAASIRVISQMGRVQELERTKFRAGIQEGYNQVVKERDEAREELNSKIGSYNKAVRNLQELKKERDNLATEREGFQKRAEEAEKKVLEQAEEIKQLKLQVEELEGKVAVLEDKLGAVDGECSEGDAQQKIITLQASLKEARAEAQSAAKEALQMYADGFAEALKQIAVTHPDLVVDEAVVNADNQTEGSTIVHVDAHSHEKTTVFYAPA